MRRHFTVAALARDDLREIYSYIYERSEQGAVATSNRLFEAFNILAQNPLLGERRDDLLADARQFSVRNYADIYRPGGAGVRILRVIHAARDIDALFRRDNS